MHCDEALLTDLYQLTMLDAYRQRGQFGPAVFELFFRRLPAARRQDTAVSVLIPARNEEGSIGAALDAALASRAAQARIDQALGGGKIDAIDFLYIDVQVF